MKMKSVALFLLLLLAAVPAFALDFDFNGTFAQDNDVLLFNFTVGSDSEVTIFSSSWDDGGFDPILALWDNAGILIGQQDDGGVAGTTVSNGTSYDYGVWDSYFTQSLIAGDYTASVSQFDNFANGTNLTDGFNYDTVTNFTLLNGYGSQTFFNGVWEETDPRTGDWAFHLLDVAEAVIDDGNAPVPEPSTMLLLGAGLAGLVVYRRKFVDS